MFWASIWIFSVTGFAVGLFSFLIDPNKMPAIKLPEIPAIPSIPDLSATQGLFDEAIKAEAESCAEFNALKDKVNKHRDEVGSSLLHIECRCNGMATVHNKNMVLAESRHKDVSTAIADLYEADKVLEERIFELESRIQRKGRK